MYKTIASLVEAFIEGATFGSTKHLFIEDDSLYWMNDPTDWTANTTPEKPELEFVAKRISDTMFIVSGNPTQEANKARRYLLVKLRNSYGAWFINGGVAQPVVNTTPENILNARSIALSVRIKDTMDELDVGKERNGKHILYGDEPMETPKYPIMFTDDGLKRAVGFVKEALGIFEKYKEHGSYISDQKVNETIAKLSTWYEQITRYKERHDREKLVHLYRILLSLTGERCVGESAYLAFFNMDNEYGQIPLTNVEYRAMADISDMFKGLLREYESVIDIANIISEMDVREDESFGTTV